MSDEYRLRAQGGTEAEWLAAAERAVVALGLAVLERGDDWLAVYHPDADVEAARKWGGHLRVEVDAGGVSLVFNLGARRKEILARVEDELRAAGVAVELVEDDD